MIVDKLLLFVFIAQLSPLPGSNACTRGFPERDRLVSHLKERTGPATRIIPEMRFICNGTIVGYTVAMRKQSGEQHPRIQIWRRNSCKFQPSVYYKAGDVIAIDGSLCAMVLMDSVSTTGLVFHCQLKETFHITVQPGDVLGLELPPKNADTSVLLFPKIVKAPVNYEFNHLLSLSSTAMLSNKTRTYQELPQIAFDFESGWECTRGFPNQGMLASDILEVEDDGYYNTTAIILIPDMNFTCDGIVVGFSFSGIDRLVVGEQDPMIQIWRRNISEPDVYHKIGHAIAVDISSEDVVCADRIKIPMASRTYWCILNEGYQLSVQPGDILGLELPPMQDNDFDILFTRGRGPNNYVFRQYLNSTDSVTLSDNHEEIQQLPQITFSVTSDQCTSGFPDVNSHEGTTYDRNQVTTELFPDLHFGCTGRIVRMKVASSRDRNQQNSPKVQIWRKNKTLPGVYYRPGPDIPIVKNKSICARSDYSGGIFQCVLNETFQVSIQPGDILGLELPPSSDIYFTPAEDQAPVSYTFERQLNSTVNISQAARQSNHLPLINLLVILGENVVFPSCSNPPAVNTKLSYSLLIGVTVGSTIPAVCFIFIVGVSVPFLLYKRKRYSPKNSLHATSHVVYSHHYQADASENIQCPNLQSSASTSNHTAVPDNMTTPGKTNKEPQYYEINDDDDKTNDNEADPSMCTSQNETHHDLQHQDLEELQCVIQNENHEYHDLEGEEQYSVEKQATSVPAEDDDYWEPADSINELYKQLCSKKYREIAREQVEIGDSLGSGQFGVVSRGVWESPKGALDVAVKQLQPGASEEEKIKFLQEAAINGQFRHPNIVMLMGVVTVGEPTMIVLELLSNGNLRSFLIQLQQKCLSDNPEHVVTVEVNEDLLIKFCQQIASGMSYLASKSFVHRDLAARNILVSQDSTCKISDFGMSHNVVDDSYSVSNGGKVPAKWTAPEAIHYKKYSTAGDVWSFGCVMYEIWSLGHKPFEELSNVEALKRVDEGYRLPPPPGTSKEIYKIMIECWQPESSDRPTFPQLVELLSRADFELFGWEEEDLRNSDPMQVKTIGAPLETAKNLYPDLQKSYITQDY